MSNLKSIVPPPELCKQIPVGEFEDSALVWEKSEKYFQAIDVMDYEYKVVTREESKGGVPAPTLEEILAELRNIAEQPGVYCGRMTGLFVCDSKEFLTPIKDKSGAAAALRLWFKVKGIEVK